MIIHLLFISLNQTEFQSNESFHVNKTQKKERTELNVFIDFFF